MSEEKLRDVDLTRLGRGRYVATNPRGGKLRFGSGEDEDFTPVELLLTAIAGCGAIDVDFITSKRSEPDRFDLHAHAVKIRDDQGNHLDQMSVSFDVAFPADDAGTSAREILASAVAKSHDRLCTVTRTVELGTPVTVEIREP